MSLTTPFHIIGPGCGGTSLISALLDFNPHIEVGFEIGAMKLLYRHQNAQPLLSSWLVRLYRYRHLFNLSATSSTKSLYANKITTEQLDGLLAPGIPLTSPCNIVRLKVVYKSLFHHQKLVLIMRDGRTCIPSKMKRGGHNLQESLLRWQRAANIIYHLHLISPSSYLLRYEDLVDTPEVVLRSLCDFLSVPFSAAMLRGTTNQKMHPRYYSSDIKTPPPPSALPSAAISLITPELVRFGYDI